MDSFELAQAFIERCASARVDALVLAFSDTLNVLGFRYYACCSHVDPLRPPQRTVMLLNYPEVWVRSYSDDELHHIDPVFQRAERALLPFSWDDSEFRSGLSSTQRNVLSEAASFGIAHGYTTPIHAPGSSGSVRASCTVIPDSRVVDTRSYFMVQLMALHLYERASRDGACASEEPSIGLPPRERQCLALAAQGKTDWEIGQLLNIAERTVHNHIERAKRRLGVITRVQAVVHALAHQQFAFGDVVRFTPPQQASKAEPSARRSSTTGPIGPLPARHKSRHAS